MPPIVKKIWILPLLWSVFGLFFIFESSLILASQKFNDPLYFARQQFVWLILSLILFFIISKIPWSLFTRLAPWLFVANLIFLILVFIPPFSLKAGGAYRWINLGFFRFQPSELLKISLTLYLAVWLTKAKRSFASFITLVLISGSLIFIEPDMGTTLLIISSALILYFIYHANLKPFFIFSLAAFFISLILIISSPYRKQRLLTLFNPHQDKLGASYQINQITIALGRGGLFGQGLGGSHQRFLYLPAASTDAILAVIGEEVGFVGLSLLLFSYLLFFSQIFKLTRFVSSPGQKLFLYTAGILIFLQTLINLGGIVVLLPLTGIPLPFISYGGSSLLTLWLLIALAQSAVNSTSPPKSARGLRQPNFSKYSKI
ncbi:MAG: FtsW/RodA/SpoVE family cell cycle protein [bacterium]|nr:FtsW/RodA/SpoVE family cell cycle protein [bacterium]